MDGAAISRNDSSGVAKRIPAFLRHPPQGHRGGAESRRAEGRGTWLSSDRSRLASAPPGRILLGNEHETPEHTSTVERPAPKREMPTTAARDSSRDSSLRESGAVQTWDGISAGRKWSIHQGSALEVLKDLDAQCVDCIITSPPYFWLRDYGVEGQIGLEDTVDDYVSALLDVMAEARRVLKRRGLAFLNLGDTYYSGKGKSHGTDAKSKKRRFGLRAVDKSGGLGLGLQRKSLIGIPWRVALALAEDGWVLRSAIIWHRKNGLPEFVRDRPSRTYEYVFMLARNRHYHFEKNELPNKIEEDLWTIPAQPRANAGLSTAPFPDGLVKRCLKIGCPPGGVVLDPFVGSGTTVRVALDTGRSGIGIDLSGEFCRHAAQMLKARV